MRKLTCILLILSVVFGVFSCSKKEEMSKKTIMTHLTNVFEKDGDFRVDTVIFLKESVPVFLSSDEIDASVSKSIDSATGILFLSGFSKAYNGQNSKVKEEDVAKLMDIAMEPFVNQLKKFENQTSEKKDLAIVRLVPNDSTKGRMKVWLYSFDERSQPRDSLEVGRKVRKRLLAYVFAKVGFAQIFEAYNRKDDSILMDNIDDRFVKELLKYSYSSSKKVSSNIIDGL